MGLPNPMTLAGDTLSNIGSGVGSLTTSIREGGERIAKHNLDWASDRAHDIVRGDPFGVGRRENESLRENLDKALDSRDDQIESLTKRVSDLSGEPDGPENESGGGFGHNARVALDKVEELKAEQADHEPGALGAEIHSVKEGETLSSIAAEKGTDLSKLLELNPEITDANTIDVGQEIKLGDFVAEASPVDKLESLVSDRPSTPETGAELEA